MPHESSIEIGALSNRSKLIALVAGPLAALILYFLLPETYINTSGQEAVFSHAGRACASIVLWMAIWWFSEAVPIAVTALLPIVLFPLLGVASLGATLKDYSNSTIYLFLGGFLIAAGIARWGWTAAWHCSRSILSARNPNRSFWAFCSLPPSSLPG